MRGNVFKRLFVVSLSFVVFLFDQARAVLLRVIGRQTRGTGVVLLYHAIPASHRERFARQMDLLCSLAVPVSADMRGPLENSKRHVAVTFDDGLTSFGSNAWPELVKRGIPVTVFVVADRLGTVPAWANYTPGLMPTEMMLSVEELRQLPDTALIGSHSLTHQMLTDVSGSEAQREIWDSRCRLESLLERPISLFSFPYGECSEDLIEQCRSAGYERVFTNLPVLAFSQASEFVTGRVDVQPTDWPIEFRLKIAGAYRWLPYAFDLKRTLFRTLTGWQTSLES